MRRRSAGRDVNVPLEVRTHNQEYQLNNDSLDEHQPDKVLHIVASVNLLIQFFCFDSSDLLSVLLKLLFFIVFPFLLELFHVFLRTLLSLGIKELLERLQVWRIQIFYMALDGSQVDTVVGCYKQCHE